MAKGIINPFVTAKKKKKKPNFRSAYDEIDTEAGPVQEPRATLDGDTYTIELEGVATIDDAADRLVSLLYAVNRDQGEELRRNGVRVMEAHEPVVTTKDELVLRRSNGGICVYVGTDTDRNETAVFRRIGYTLTKLPIADLLKQHRVSVRRRG